MDAPRQNVKAIILHTRQKTSKPHKHPKITWLFLAPATPTETIELLIREGAITIDAGSSICSVDHDATVSA